MIDTSSGIPKYVQLCDILKQEMQDNYTPGGMFLTEQEIMKKYNVSCVTVATAMKILVKEGCVTRKRGEGTFVNEFKYSGTSYNTPEILVSSPANRSNPSYNPFAWFIQNRIERGIINSYRGSVRLLDNTELSEEILSSGERSIILVHPHDEILRLAEENKGNFVLVSSRGDYNCEYNKVGCAQLPGVYEIMRYLIDNLGHKRIGGIFRHEDRFAGYQIGLRTFGIDYDEALVERVEFGSDENAYNAMKKLMELKERPTAIFADTDVKAIGAMRAAKDLGIKIPDNVSIVGFDDIPEASTSEPPLTTVRLPYYQMGEEAVSMMKKLIKEKKPVKNIELSGKLIVRDSCKGVAE